MQVVSSGTGFFWSVAIGFPWWGIGGHKGLWG